MESWRGLSVHPTQWFPQGLMCRFHPCFQAGEQTTALKHGQEKALGTALCNTQVPGAIEGLPGVTLLGAFPTVKNKRWLIKLFNSSN